MTQSTEGNTPARNLFKRLFGGGSSPLSAHVRLLAAPAFKRIISYEGFLRFVIPFLSLVFIGTIAVYRSIELTDAYTRTETEARERLQLVATTLTTQINAAEAGLSDHALKVQLQAVIAESLPPDLPSDGRYILVTTKNGIILTSLPEYPNLDGHRLAELFVSSQPIFQFGEHAGVQWIEFDGESAIATIHHLSGRLGVIALVHTRDRLFAEWRSDVSANVTLFVVTSIILSILIYGFFSQVARAKQADDVYSSTQSLVDTALNRGKCGLFDWDLARGKMFWSKSLYEILGLPPRDDLIGFAEVSNLVHPEDGSLFNFAESIVDENRHIIDRVFRMKHATGSWIWMRARAEQVVQNEYNEPHLIGIAVDITEQREVEEENKKADLRLREAVDLLPEAFVLWDSKNRLVMCNSTYQKLNGLNSEDVVEGTPYSEVMKSARKPISTKKVKELKKFGSHQFNYTMQLDDGRWFQIAEQRTKDDGWVSVGTEITKVKQSEAESISKTNKLQELTRKLGYEKERAETANRSKSDFVASISHELRTPLNAIIGFSDVMRQEAFGKLGHEKYKEYSNDINESGMDLLHLINDILDMSKIEAGRMDLKFETFNLVELLKDACRTIDTEAKKKHLDIQMKSKDNIPLTADRRSIKQILLNVLSNSVKFTEKDGSISLTTLEKDGKVLIQIEDTGIGIPAKDIAKLGKPFVQLENQMTRSHDGSGLGLSIAESLAELHDGKLIIESKEKVGTKVTIALPQKVQSLPTKGRNKRG